MKKYLMIALLVGTAAIVTGCSTKTPAPAPQTPPPTTQNTPAPTTPVPPTPTPTPTTTASGKDIYDKNCAGCHGAGGVGASAKALNTEKSNLAEVIITTTKGKESMPAYAGKLSVTEIQAVSQYVADLKK